MDIIGQKLDILSNYVHTEFMAPKSVKHDPDMFKNRAIFTLAMLKKSGVSHQTLYRWLKEGRVIKVGRGNFAHPSYKIDPSEYEYAVACSKFGKKSAIGGLTALFKYGLIEQVPSQVWVVVPTGKKSTQRVYRCLRTNSQLKDGIDDFGHYRITNIERTLLEALKFSTKIGSRVALQAVRKALRENLTSEVKLGKMATKLKMRGVLEKNWESVAA